MTPSAKHIQSILAKNLQVINPLAQLLAYHLEPRGDELSLKQIPGLDYPLCYCLAKSTFNKNQTHIYLYDKKENKGIIIPFQDKFYQGMLKALTNFLSQN